MSQPINSRMDSAPIDYSRYEALKLSLKDGIMTVTISNPGRKNAINLRMSEELTVIWDDLWSDPDVKVIILTGDGNDFCAGADLVDMVERRREAPTVQLTHPVTRPARKNLMAIIECEKPVIAKVRGAAYGLGATFALACDMVFASENARFCDSHVKAGMVAGDGGALLWPLAVGIHRAKEYLMTGEPVPAKEADAIGLINRCLPDDELDAHVQAMAEKLCALPPHAVNYTKVSLNVALKQMTASAFETSLAYEIYTMGMNDFKEATTAFVEKRPPNFKGL